MKKYTINDIKHISIGIDLRNKIPRKLKKKLKKNSIIIRKEQMILNSVEL